MLFTLRAYAKPINNDLIILSLHGTQALPAGMVGWTTLLNMATLTFDTLKFANKLKAAALPPDQAEAQAEALAEVIELNIQDLVTKEDLIVSLKDLEQRLIIKLGGMMIVAVGVIVALVKFIT